MKKIVLLLLVVLTTLGLSAKNPVKTVTIQTNGKCGRCANVMKTSVPTFQGVQTCVYDMATAKITVTYDTKVTTPDAIRQGISKLGYDADAVKANPEARAKLPACCRGEAKCGGDAKSNTKADEHKCGQSTEKAGCCGKH